MRVRLQIFKNRSISKLPRAKRRDAELRIQELRVALRNHPCHSCHDRDSHLRTYERGARLVRENRSLQERVDARTNVIVRRFDLIQILLKDLGYLDGESITTHGRLLAKIYSPKIPHGKIAEVLKTMILRWSDINDRELELNLEEMRQPDPGFSTISLRWAQGHSLTSILKGTDITVGDFIRTMKQIIDLLRQIGNASPHLKDICDQALDKVDRGIVTYAGVVG